MPTDEFITWHDATGTQLTVGRCGPESCTALKAMYDAFGQMSVSQGLPPAQKDIRDRWVEGLLLEATNFAVWRDNAIIGHAAIIPNEERRNGEYIIFVRDAFRNRGVGTRLTTMALERGRELGLASLWLTVESFNFRAIRLYRKAGFTFHDQGERERTMLCRL